MKTLKNVILLIAGLAIALNIQAQKQSNPVVKSPVFSGKTKAIRDVPVIIPGPLHEKPETPENPKPETDILTDIPPEGKFFLNNVQETHGQRSMSNPILNVEGIDNVQGYRAADPNGDIGKDHYVQTINASFAVFDRQGNIIYGPVAYQSIFESFPGPWNEINWCDPVIVYDHMADRWAFTSMSLSSDQELFYEMVAVSVSSDPLGEYYCYAYQFENINDYPKMSVWPNGYYITYNIFESTWQYMYSLVTAVDREAMLSGAPDATMIQFVVEVPAPLTFRRSPLTADFNGPVVPEDQACPVVVPEYSMTGFPWEVRLNIFEFMPDWSNPLNSTFDSVNQFMMEPTFPSMFANAPQPGNFHDVEPINFYLMYPLHYRNFGSHESMVGCQTLYDGELHYLRWYELRKETANWGIYQLGNYSPDSASRYVPSISINGNGDIAMGFTKSSLEINPSIWLTGRQYDDPPGEMTFGEIELYRGLNYANNYGSQSGRNRWGDYASMMVDPVDDSTFWFTSMYTLEHTNVGNWSTRIFAFNISEEPNAPYAWAGNDTTICGFELFETNGLAENYSSVYWETRGDGIFSTNNQLNVAYLRGNQDLENGSVTLCLNTTGYISGSSCADSMVLYLNKLPEVEAGNDDTLCVNYSVTLDGSGSFANHYYWTSTGAGTFNDSCLLKAIYTPSASDTSLEYVTLNLHAEPLFPCTEGKTDSLRLFVEPCLGIDEINVAHFSLSLFPNPTPGIFNLSASFSEESDPVIRIFDAQGNRLFSGSFYTLNKTIQKQFDLSQNASGIYYLQMINGKYSKTIRIIKTGK